MEANEFDHIEAYQSEDIMSLNHSRIINRIGVALNRYDDEYDVFPELELELSTGKCKPDVSVYRNLPSDWFNDIIFYNQALLLRLRYYLPGKPLQMLPTKLLSSISRQAFKWFG